MNYTNLKVEAAIFMLLALTFAAVLGKDAFTSQQLELMQRAAQFYPFAYGDKDEGGKSTVTFDQARPMEWTCTLAPGAQYAYCGYGLQLDINNDGTGVNLAKYQNIHLKMTYTGVGHHMRFLIQTAVPDNLRDRVKDGETMPMVAEFEVKEGVNNIDLTMDQFVVEGWWLSARNIRPDEVTPALDRVVSIAMGSGSTAPMGRFDVDVESLDFKGQSLSTAQWYLLILGAWLVLTGGFLVYRFLSVRKGYEVEQKRQAEEARELAAARTAAEAASSAKSQFLANMSHELRTPLNAILGYAQLLKSSDLSSQQLSAVKTIQHSGEHLLTVITDILDIAKVEAGRMELMPGGFDIRACALTVGQMVRVRAEDKGLSFSISIAEDVPQYVVADEKRMRQVLINLLGNAIKFTAAGEVRLSVTVVSAGEESARLCFAVSDTGVGIQADQLDSIFRPFEQAGNSISKSGGTGLGLSITHQIVKLMGGDIKVESEVGQGSCFTVEAEFPLAVAEDDREATNEPVVVEPETQSVVAPSPEVLARLLEMARAGNLRAIRKEIPGIIAMGEAYRGFAERLDGLAAAYQSPAVLRMIEQYVEERRAA
ncbi:histidine kinase-, DNA gyrase B-, and HSP90-like ATPase family protein [Asticcacaulis biprosthecium C19]|uniref:histidine kinase n=1 Tax=Asticcacaulis biprosthecium C19 TaxID=715226 RepID=F4QGL6_9CAUL|nr:ATP-binding protein [Asticcacaulis biprosthecium]EGF93697.1 histidine kinase-, DNA gyrase B-, and HSP90-like ATPase family protein [Asticcacaulis biprosthecium C19]